MQKAELIGRPADLLANSSNGDRCSCCLREGIGQLGDPDIEANCKKCAAVKNSAGSLIDEYTPAWVQDTSVAAKLTPSMVRMSAAELPIMVTVAAMVVLPKQLHNGA